MSINNKKIIIWDWDGVIVDSLEYKHVHVWRDIFYDDLEKQESVIDFIKTPEGRKLNRYGLIKHVLATFDKKDLENLTDDELKKHPLIKKYVDIYNTKVKDGIRNIGMRHDVRNVLRTLHNDGHHMYVVSGGGSDTDLMELAEFFDIKKYFKAIFGFGVPGVSLTAFGKYKNFERIVKLENIKEAKRYVVVGDSMSDYDLARDIGCDFVAIPNRWNKWNKNKKIIPMIVADINKIPEKLQSLKIK
jgi:phosphoglycolate phosphatase-like HAD superfamily hydrolase